MSPATSLLRVALATVGGLGLAGSVGAAPPSKIAVDERVVFFDTAASRTPDGQAWLVPIHGWIHELEDRRVRKRIAARILEKKYGLVLDADSRPFFDRRVNLFLADNERGKRIQISLGDRRFVLPPSGKNGHFQARLTLDLATVARGTRDGVLEYRAVLASGDRRRFDGRVHLVEPHGVSVISDIDDTVKVSHVRDHKRLMRATFMSPFRVVPGMSKLYRQWAGRGAVLHFASSSPWHLYEDLHAMLQKDGFPPATSSLKSVRFTDRTISNLFSSFAETKPPQIEAPLRTWPSRRFVLVGDSGEKDPEVYARMYADHPRQVLRIFIRNVTEARADDPRFTRIFARVPANVWQLFKDPSEVQWRW